MEKDFVRCFIGRQKYIMVRCPFFFFFLVFAENKMKEEKDENCENSVLHEIVKKMKYSSQFHARAREVLVEYAADMEEEILL